MGKATKKKKATRTGAGASIHLLTTAQVAEQLACTEDTVWALCKNKRLAHLRLGSKRRGHYRFRPEDVAAFIAAEAKA